jgi:hypothetical protein
MLDQPGALRGYPRVRLGSVVLSRRKWFVPAAMWPAWPAAHAMRAPFLRDLERWRRGLGLPEQVFVRAIPGSPRNRGGGVRNSRGGIPGPGSTVHSWKPQYVDFRSAFVLAAVARRMRFDTGWVVVEEALPAPDEFAARWDGRRYASAVVIKTGREGRLR